MKYFGEFFIVEHSLDPRLVAASTDVQKSLGRFFKDISPDYPRACL